MRTLVLTLSFLAACNNGVDGMPEDNITLDWAEGDEFHVATEYRAVANRTENTAVSLDGDSITLPVDENWSGEVVWTFQTIEEEVVPVPSDQLYDYAVKADGSIAAITVLRAYVDGSLNEDPELLESDPVVYMVFHSDRDRLAAIVSYSNVDGERLEQAFSTKEMGTSYSALSQSMITAAPTYLAPFSAGYRDEVKTLENGSTFVSDVVDDGMVTVSYDDEMGGDLVFSTYEDGAPWPSYTETSSVKSRLLTDAEVDARRMPGLLPDPPEDYDFRGALSSSIDLDRALRLDETTIGGGWSGGAPEGYRPWAGSWWPLKKGELIWGQNFRNTYSDQIKSDVDPLLQDMDGINAELREMDRGSDEYNAKVETYRTKQGEVLDVIRGFYGEMLSDVNGGSITFSDGQMVHVAHGETVGHDEDWTVDLDDLSPLDKYALQNWQNGNTSPNPFFAPAWEVLNQYNPGGESWWGKCNGWAAAAILTDEPRVSVTTQVGGQDMEWSPGDIKGLLTNSHYSTYSRFYGERYNDEEQDIKDLTPKNFHQIIQFYLRDQQVPFVFDTTADAPVWNYPAWWADVTVTETTDTSAASLINVNTADLATLDALPGIGESKGKAIIAYREFHGPFQTIEELTNVSGIGSSTLAGLQDLVTVQVADTSRTFDVRAEVKFTTDGVPEEHIDADMNEPRGFTNIYDYTLVTDAHGVVIEGTWDNEREHPDFAWVPYSNPMGFPRGGSENEFLSYEYIIDAVGDYDRH